MAKPNSKVTLFFNNNSPRNFRLVFYFDDVRLSVDIVLSLNEKKNYVIEDNIKIMLSKRKLSFHLYSLIAKIKLYVLCKLHILLYVYNILYVIKE